MAAERSMKWRWNYVTRCDNKNAECNICNTNINLRLQLRSLQSHLSKEHSDVYDPSTLHLHYYEIESEKVGCNYCIETYKLYDYHNIKRHLADKHMLNEKIANEFEIWVEGYRLQFNETCETCTQFNEINSFKLMIHLYKDHNITVPSKFIPAKLSESLNNLFSPLIYAKDIPTSRRNQQQICSTDFGSTKWRWNYVTRCDNKNAECNICNTNIKVPLLLDNIKSHLSNQHSNVYDPSNLQYYDRENEKLGCIYCNWTCNKSYHYRGINYHLVKTHALNRDIANELKIWVEGYRLQFNKTCETCKQFNEINSFELMIHLYKVHNITVPSQFIPVRLSKSLYNLFSPLILYYYYAKDIPTSSSNQQQTCSTDFPLSDRLYKLFCPDKNVENIPTSSTNQQPLCSNNLENFNHDMDDLMEIIEKDSSSVHPHDEFFNGLSKLDLLNNYDTTATSSSLHQLNSSAKSC